MLGASTPLSLTILTVAKLHIRLAISHRTYTQIYPCFIIHQVKPSVHQVSRFPALNRDNFTLEIKNNKQ